jgi:hypothetical protein
MSTIVEFPVPRPLTADEVQNPRLVAVAYRTYGQKPLSQRGAVKFARGIGYHGSEIALKNELRDIYGGPGRRSGPLTAKDDSPVADDATKQLIEEAVNEALANASLDGGHYKEPAATKNARPQFASIFSIWWRSLYSVDE